MVVPASEINRAFDKSKYRYNQCTDTYINLQNVIFVQYRKNDYPRYSVGDHNGNATVVGMKIVETQCFNNSPFSIYHIPATGYNIWCMDWSIPAFVW